jgi:DNA-binding transcriptional ArsR family regulator
VPYPTIGRSASALIPTRMIVRSRSNCFLQTARRIGYYTKQMITGPLIAEIAALVGEPARATMLSALLDGRALTASELAYAARVTPQTASTHLAKLTEAGLLSPIRDGRHRYSRLASPRVVEMLDGIVAVALENRPRYRPLSRQAQELSAARICYDHLAGRLSVNLTDSLITHEYIVVGDEAAEITQAGMLWTTGHDPYLVGVAIGGLFRGCWHVLARCFLRAFQCHRHQHLTTQSA